MINALGLLEVSGLSAGIAAADAMLKTANVRLINQTFTKPGLVTLIIEGDLAACRAALQTGVQTAKTIGEVISYVDMGRPDRDTESLASLLYQYPINPPAPTVPAVSLSADEPASFAPKPSAPVGIMPETPLLLTIQEEKPAPAAETNPHPETIAHAPILLFIAQQPQGCNLSRLTAHFGYSAADTRNLLEQLIAEGKIRRKGQRYFIVKDKT